jgi:transcriptional regulator with XRE-family HTH domain
VSCINTNALYEKIQDKNTYTVPVWEILIGVIMEPMEMTKIILRKNLKELRKIKGWNQEDLAEASNYSTGFVADVERGKSWVSPEAIEAFAEALGVNIDRLFAVDMVPIKPLSIKDAINLASSVPDSFWSVVQEHEMTEEVWAALGDAIAGTAKKKKLLTTKEA